LLPLSKAEIARQFMADKQRFGDAMLDFNLFFLGFKSDHLKAGSDCDRAVFDFPNAVAAAQALLRGGDYLKLFDLEGPYYMAPLRDGASDEPPQPDDVGPSPAQLRPKTMREIEAVFADAVAFANAKPAPALSVLGSKVETSPTAGKR